MCSGIIQPISSSRKRLKHSGRGERSVVTNHLCLNRGDGCLKHSSPFFPGKQKWFVFDILNFPYAEIFDCNDLRLFKRCARECATRFRQGRTSSSFRRREAMGGANTQASLVGRKSRTNAECPLFH